MPSFYPDKTYQVINGMTFEDFCNSKYNIDGWRIVDSVSEGIYHILHQYGDVITSDGRLVNSYEIINPDIDYYWTA